MRKHEIRRQPNRVVPDYPLSPGPAGDSFGETTGDRSVGATADASASQGLSPTLFSPTSDGSSRSGKTVLALRKACLTLRSVCAISVHSRLYPSPLFTPCRSMSTFFAPCSFDSFPPPIRPLPRLAVLSFLTAPSPPQLMPVPPRPPPRCRSWWRSPRGSTTTGGRTRCPRPRPGPRGPTSSPVMRGPSSVFLVVPRSREKWLVAAVGVVACGRFWRESRVLSSIIFR